MKWQSIVFDLDDTLYPERAYVLSGFRAVARWMANHEDIPEDQGYAELLALFESGVRAKTFNQWLSAHQRLSDELVHQLIQVYRDHDPHLRTFAEIPPLLDQLKGIISDGYLAVQRKKLDALGIASYFDAVIFSDTWGRDSWKPSERPFREALRSLQSRPERTVYIGDNPLKDFYGARASGWHTIRLQQPHGEYRHLSPPSPDFSPDITLFTFANLASYLSSV